MLEVTCKLLQSVYLGRLFTITPVWMGDEEVRLYIVARDGGELTINEQAQLAANEVWLQEDQPQDESPEDGQPPNLPSDDSDLQH
ncbi:MAG: hypothetical protein K0U59_08835 [Gammaproteobacteria bacterium]|nr:hypothetical protein [Gammaproteobacteria bacterium]